MLSDTLKVLRALIGEERISLRVDCSNLETVYIEEIDGGRFQIDDRCETFAYLSKTDGDTYIPLSNIGIGEIRKICERNCCQLICVDPADEDDVDNEWFAIGTYAKTDEEIKYTVECVSSAIDEVFAFARK